MRITNCDCIGHKYGPHGWPGGEQTLCGTKHFSTLVHKPPPVDEQVLELFDYCALLKHHCDMY